MDTSTVLPHKTEAPLFTRGEAIAHGIKDRELRTNFRKVIHGIYTTRDVEITHELRCRAASITLPDDAILTGRSAATLLGVPLAGPNDPVEVLVSGHSYMNRRFGLRAWARKSSVDEHVAWSSIRRATPTRAAFDVLARNAPSFGIANCDAMLHAGLVDEDDLARFMSTRRYYGVRKAQRAFELLDGRAESIPESVLRVTLVEGGLVPTPQVEVYDERGFVARVDLAFEESKLAVEYDGAWHADPGQQQRDRQRRRRLRECGWTVVVVTADSLYGDPKGVVAEVKHALGRRR
ncbi:endonuclease domain-containing protein [Saccharopolyspora sp. ASAGF58]|uniref:endonuclease domain-containing protein n=1 Tax=Saccharopolyspora sp. ASAGF58 TaxID=2719023 RepID=UPI00143FE3C2|nr:DUF559 domain-containing protein [Saccharopolyspora sp. ASAGF58]QIZ34796.1 DUF559 domain-containing protein [Saccharopolyspora sp. ASAGF58]